MLSNEKFSLDSFIVHVEELLEENQEVEVERLSITIIGI